jgi:hypothetical protein
MKAVRAFLSVAREVKTMAYQSIEYLYCNGARLGMGTDLFGERYHPMQNRETASFRLFKRFL